jgi:ribonuclease-3
MLGLIRKFYNYNFSKDRDIAKRLRPILGYVPVDLGLYKLAFYHKSTNPEKATTIVAEYLFNKYPNSDEGFLTKMRSKMVKRNSLNRIGDEMGLDIILQEYNNARLSRSMLGNAVEALVGAVYLELGYERTKKFVIRKVLRRYLDIHELETYDDNYKSQLLEWSQKHGKTVMYKVIAKYKFEKRDRFKVAVLIDGVKIAVADDFNKKSAEQTASEKALASLGLSFTEDENDQEPVITVPAKVDHLN